MVRIHVNRVDLLFNAFQPPEIAIEVEPLQDGICAISGKSIAEGVAIAKLVTHSTNQPHEIFKVPNTEHVSIEAARLFKQMKAGGITGNLLATLDGGHRPMISRDSAVKAERPCWHDLVMTIAPGTITVAIFSSDTKRRFWVNAPVGIVGKAWQVYLHDDSSSGIITIDIHRLRECMTLLERLYTLGISKDALRTSIYDVRYMQTEGVSIRDLTEWERQLSDWRHTPEFQLSIFIVQKQEQDTCPTPVQHSTYSEPKPQQTLFD